MCYWKKAILSTVRNIKSKTVDELSNRNTDLSGASDTLLKKFIQIGKDVNENAGVIRHSEHGIKQTMYIDHLMILYTERHAAKPTPTCEEFLSFCCGEMSHDICKRIFESTKDQSKKSEWYHLRFGRITASKLYETSRCDTYDGSLVGSLMGSRGFKGNAATLRGQTLEAEIFDLLKSTAYQSLEKCGIVLRPDLPIFGASPDGIADDFIVEIKCPTKKKTISNYIADGVLKKKVYFQMQLQMAMTGKRKGILVVADPKFEENKKITTTEVDFNEIELEIVMQKCKVFWNKTIFPLLK